MIGKFKDETQGIPVVEFAGLRSKMYSFIKEEGKGDKKTKSLKKWKN